MLEYEHLRGGNKWVLVLVDENANGVVLNDQCNGGLIGLRLWWR